MFRIKSFCGEGCFLHNDAPDEAVKEATSKADQWLEDLEEEWENVEVTALTSQYAPCGDYAMYFITMSVKIEGLKE
jgi:hypothetical protein